MGKSENEGVYIFSLGCALMAQLRRNRAIAPEPVTVTLSTRKREMIMSNPSNPSQAVRFYQFHLFHQKG